MIDWDRLEQELADARRGERIADRIVRTARRRRRQRTLRLSIGAAIISAAIVVPLELAAVPDDTATRADAGSGPAAATAGGHTAAGVRAAIYAAALAGGPRPRPLSDRVWVRDHLCDRIPTSPASSDCRNAPIPPEVQREVVRVLGPAVRFTARPPMTAHPSRASIVAFGRLRVHGDSARLGMETMCGLGCGEGQTLVLRFHDGQWQVSGTTGPRWVS